MSLPMSEVLGYVDISWFWSSVVSVCLMSCNVSAMSDLKQGHLGGVGGQKVQVLQMAHITGLLL